MREHAMKRLMPPLLILIILAVLYYSWWIYPFSDFFAFPFQDAIVGKLLLSGIWFGIAWLIKRLTEFLVGGRRLDTYEEKIPKLVFDLFGIVLFFCALLIVVGAVFEKPIVGLLTTSGILTGVIAFAIRDLIADVFSGIALAIEKPLKVGDWLQFGEATPTETGRVVEMNWRAVRMITVQGRTLVYPNHQLTSENFINLSLPERYFRTIKSVVVDFSVPPERAAEILMSAIKATPGLVTSMPPLVRIVEFNKRGVVFSMHFWVPDYPQMFALERKVMENVVHFLHQAGYSPAYPKLEHDPTWRQTHEVLKKFDIVDVLRRIDIFSPLSGKELDSLSAYLQVSHRVEGEQIVKEADEGDSLFVIVTGLVRVSKTIADNPVELELLRPGDFFGEMSLLTGMPRSATITTVTECWLIEISAKELKPILEANPQVIDQLGESQAKRMRALKSLGQIDEAGNKKIKETGLPGYLKQRISHFFGL